MHPENTDDFIERDEIGFDRRDKLFELPRTDRLAHHTYYALLFVVPANAGPHSHRLMLFPTDGGPSLLNNVRLRL